MRLEAQEMAMLLKERTNKQYEMVALGKVVYTSPLKVTDDDGFILDQGDELLVTYHVQKMIQDGLLTAGNTVCMVSTSDYSKYIVIDKVV